MTKEQKIILKEMQKTIRRLDVLIESFLSNETDANVSMNRNTIRVIITDYLQEIGIPAHVKGYRYLRDTIEMVVNDMSYLDRIIELYSDVAKKNGTTYLRVERAIRHAIETTWSRENIKEIERKFGFMISQKTGKPENREFIAKLTDYIVLNLE